MFSGYLPTIKCNITVPTANSQTKVQQILAVHVILPKRIPVKLPK